MRRPLAGDEEVSLRPREHREPAVERVHAEDRTEPQVLLGEERPDVAGQGERISDQGQTRRGGRRRRRDCLRHRQVRHYHGFWTLYRPRRPLTRTAHSRRSGE